MSVFPGLPFGTEQKVQPRVQTLPRIMNVAAPRWKHSWMLGQRADSHTVWSFSPRRSFFSFWTDSKCVTRFAQELGQALAFGTGDVNIYQTFHASRAGPQYLTI